MSRTDNTDPWWVRGYHARPTKRRVMHDRNCDSDPEGGLRRYSDTDRSHKCDIDHPTYPGNWRVAHCCYWPIDDEVRFRYTRRPSREEFLNLYWAPERASVRDALRNAVKDYRAHLNTRHLNDNLDIEDIDEDPYEYLYDVDTDIPTRQHRHTPFNGGWWD